jgi:DNA-directed RNA polymerase subunit RPC12/RpoP
MPKRWCSDCRKLFDLDSTGTLRCPDCQAKATAKRNARPSTTRRGYGSHHRRTREQLLAQWKPGDPCARCGKPMWNRDDIDLGHTDDRTGYRGLEHSACNRGNR